MSNWRLNRRICGKTSSCIVWNRYWGRRAFIHNCSFSNNFLILCSENILILPGHHHIFRLGSKSLPSLHIRRKYLFVLIVLLAWCSRSELLLLKCSRRLNCVNSILNLLVLLVRRERVCQVVSIRSPADSPFQLQLAHSLLNLFGAPEHHHVVSWVLRVDQVLLLLLKTVVLLSLTLLKAGANCVSWSCDLAWHLRRHYHPEFHVFILKLLLLAANCLIVIRLLLISWGARSRSNLEERSILLFGTRYLAWGDTSIVGCRRLRGNSIGWIGLLIPLEHHSRTHILFLCNMLLLSKLLNIISVIPSDAILRFVNNTISLIFACHHEIWIFESDSRINIIFRDRISSKRRRWNLRVISSYLLLQLLILLYLLY